MNVSWRLMRKICEITKFTILKHHTTWENWRVFYMSVIFRLSEPLIIKVCSLNLVVIFLILASNGKRILTATTKLCLHFCNSLTSSLRCQQTAATGQQWVVLNSMHGIGICNYMRHHMHGSIMQNIIDYERGSSFDLGASTRILPSRSVCKISHWQIARYHFCSKGN